MIAVGVLVAAVGATPGAVIVYHIACWWLTRRHRRQPVHNWCDLVARWCDDKPLTIEELNRIIRGPHR